MLINLIVCIFLHYGLLHGIEYNSLCYAVGPVVILYIVVAYFTPPLSSLPFGNHRFAYYVQESLFIYF